MQGKVQDVELHIQEAHPIVIGFKKIKGIALETKVLIRVRLMVRIAASIKFYFYVIS